VAVDQEYVEKAPTLIVVCSNTSRSEKRYGIRGREFYSIMDGAFASMLILFTSVNEGTGTGFVGAFEDDKVSEILKLPRDVRPIGIVTLGYPKDTEPFERLERTAMLRDGRCRCSIWASKALTIVQLFVNEAIQRIRLSRTDYVITYAQTFKHIVANHANTNS
jgi:hypothetical protein